MATLFDLLIGAHRKMGTLRMGVATGGTSVTCKDNTLKTLTTDDDYNNGTIFIVSAVAPTSVIDGQFQRITDYAATSGVFTFSTLAASVTAGTIFGYTTPEFHYSLTVELANDALQSLGPLVYVDKDTITTSAVQEIYSAAVAWKYSPPIRIDVQTEVGSTANYNGWQTTWDWEYQPSSAGATAQIIFPNRLPANRKVRVWYESMHTAVRASTAAIDERIFPELAVLAVVDKMYEYRNSLNRGSVPFDMQRWQDAKSQLEAAKKLWRPWKPSRRRKLTIAGGEGAESWAPKVNPYGPG